METKHQRPGIPIIRIATLFLNLLRYGSGCVDNRSNRKFLVHPPNNQILTFDMFDLMGGTRTLGRVVVTTNLIKSYGFLYISNCIGFRLVLVREETIKEEPAIMVCKTTPRQLP